MAGTERSTLDPDALKAAIDAVEGVVVKYPRLYATGAYVFVEELAEAAVNAYLDDVIRQLDLRPCEDCEEDQDGSSDE